MKQHAKRALVSHIIPAVLMIVLFITIFASFVPFSMNTTYEEPSLFMTSTPLLFVLAYITAVSDRRRQVAVLPDPGALPRGRRHRRLAADRADAATRSRRCAQAGVRAAALNSSLTRGADCARVRRAAPRASSTCSMSRPSG